MVIPIGLCEIYIVRTSKGRWPFQGGGGSDVPEFKFQVEFPIGLHVILQLRIKKLPNITIILSENPSRCNLNLEPLLK